MNKIFRESIKKQKSRRRKYLKILLESELLKRNFIIAIPKKYITE